MLSFFAADPYGGFRLHSKKMQRFSEAYYQNAESLYFKGFQRILPHRCPKVFYTNFINLDRGGFEAYQPLSIPLF